MGRVYRNGFDGATVISEARVTGRAARGQWPGVVLMSELLRRLPHGWDTPVGPFGKMLSNGERQRVALARALLRNPLILILDESTSALSSRAEYELLTNLEAYYPRMTVLLVSHRPSAAEWADRVLHVEGGGVRVEDGGVIYRPALPGTLGSHRSFD
jgi:ABC-type transport system involved in cytochrome bd biosynthesis fused ATPase/permease subunit